MIDFLFLFHNSKCNLVSLHASPATCHREGFYLNVNLKCNSLLFPLTFILQHRPPGCTSPSSASAKHPKCSARHGHVRLFWRLFPAWVVGTFLLVGTSIVCVELLDSPIPLKVTWMRGACALIISVCPQSFFSLSFGTEVGGSPTFWVFDLRARWPC